MTDAANRFYPEAVQEERAYADALMFTRLVASIQLDPHRQLSTALAGRCHDLVRESTRDRMANIGEWLIGLADGRVSLPDSAKTKDKRLTGSRWLHSVFFSSR